MLHFFIIILVQALFLFLLYIRRKITATKFVTVVLMSMIAGVLFGFAFDSVFGVLGLFTYTLQSPGSLYGTGLTLPMLVLNGLLSYGIAFATVYFLLPKRNKSRKLAHKNMYIFGMLILVFVPSYLLYVTSKSVYSLFLGGVAVILLGEMLALLFNEKGIFLSLIVDKKYTAFVIFWINCISIGLLYEAVNYLFPFWVWLPGVFYSHVIIETLVIVFGYVVLFHPMMIFWQLMQKKGWLTA